MIITDYLSSIPMVLFARKFYLITKPMPASTPSGFGQPMSGILPRKVRLSFISWMCSRTWMGMVRKTTSTMIWMGMGTPMKRNSLTHPIQEILIRWPIDPRTVSLPMPPFGFMRTSLWGPRWDPLVHKILRAVRFPSRLQWARMRAMHPNCLSSMKMVRYERQSFLIMKIM